MKIRDHSLSIALGGIFLLQTAGSYYTGRQYWFAEEGRAEGFWTWWVYEYLTSTLADTYGVLLIVLFSKWFFERGSVESKDPEEA